MLSCLFRIQTLTTILAGLIEATQRSAIRVQVQDAIHFGSHLICGKSKAPSTIVGIGKANREFSLLIDLPSS